MKRSGWSLGCALGLGLFAAALASCEEKSYEVAAEDAAAEVSQAYCGAMFSCHCDGRRYDAESECRTQTAGEIEQLLAVGQGSGLEYDPTCLGEVLRLLDEHTCDPYWPDGDGCEPPCNVFFGDRGLGQPCEYVGSFSNCAQGLRCQGQVCADPCDREGPAGKGQSCENRACDEGLWCDFEDWTCRPLPDVGQPCANTQCRDGLFCDRVDPSATLTGVCAAPMDDGRAGRGHVECKSLHCPVGACEPMPGRDEACPAGVCAYGLQCTDGVCTTASAAVCWNGIGV